MTTYTFRTTAFGADSPTPTTVYIHHTTSGLGYVRVNLHGREQQVCERLRPRGTTLLATPETLPAVMRRAQRLYRYDQQQVLSGRR